MKDDWTLDSRKEYSDYCITDFYVKSTGLSGEGHGKTEISIEDVACTNMQANIIGKYANGEEDPYIEKLIIKLNGDAEIINFKKRLQFILNNLNTLGE